ncbi:MAG: hypothetical protein PHG12_10665, partial [Sphaerochaeta sp.]|nr:hypothetical protein [Sphaerochaeta sp.]
MLTSYHEKIPPVLTSYRSAPNAGNRSFWQSLDPTQSILVRKRSGDAQKQAIPALLATEYLAFTRKGSRIAYESPYFKRRTLLASLVLGYCIDRSEALLDAIIDGIWAICEET